MLLIVVVDALLIPSLAGSQTSMTVYLQVGNPSVKLCLVDRLPWKKWKFML